MENGLVDGFCGYTDIWTEDCEDGFTDVGNARIDRWNLEMCMLQICRCMGKRNDGWIDGI